MNINRNNYESFFLDYFDGSLSSDQVEQLFVFLSNNNDLKIEFDDFENISLCDEKVQFPDKKSLKKQLISIEDFNKYCIDKIEGNISADKEILLNDYLKKNPDKQNEYNIFKKTKLYPDLSVVFDNKQVLKKLNFNKDFDQICVANLENDLTLAEKNRFAKFLNKNPQKQKEYNLFKKTILTSDKSIVFEDKMLLKKYFVSKHNKIKTIFSYVSAAAAVVLFFFAFSYYQDLLKTETGIMSNIDSTGNRVYFSNQASIINGESNRKKYFYVEEDNASVAKQENKKNHVERIVRQKILIKPIQSYRNIRFANNYDKNIIAIPKTYRIKRVEGDKYNTLTKAIAQTFTEKVIKPENSSSNVNFWDIAKAGIRAVNKLTGSKIELEKQTKKNSNEEILAVNSRNFNFSTKIKKNK